ncbi:biopolymer transport protein ExbD/TolR [Coraliomargarita sp. CAG:312]|nr:biopolymer transport protein ExbD/TolR [Coraliomargarita sp. CAG:312]
MKFRARSGLAAMTELNVTPLMDLAFSLLIIFMISTPLLEQTIPINLPKQEENPSNARPEIEFQVISINAKGQIYWGKQPVDMVELNSLLESMSKMPDPPAISFRGDFSLPYQKIVDVIDAIKRHNLTKLHLDTEVR